MDAACFLGPGVFRHEQRYLVTMKEIIEIHEMLQSGKREHSQSLSRVRLRIEKNTRCTLLPHAVDFP
jgi:hypothetical protein